VVAAPKFLVSGPELLIACCNVGVVGSIAADDARTIEILVSWLAWIVRGLDQGAEASGVAPAPWALNIIVQSDGSSRFADELALADRYARVSNHNLR
jgi:nitronate monooxygenase